MSNNYFNFKQFTIHQDKCAMKVGTDGVLLGAWVNVDNCKNIMNIGTGTGIIAIMLAQRTHAQIDAVEIEENAYSQASENIKKSPWSERINIYHQSIQNFTSHTKYDLIISNPPFFKQSLLSKSDERKIARHTLTLNGDDLLQFASKNITQTGKLAVILPFAEGCVFIAEAVKYGFFCIRRTTVYALPNLAPKRLLIELSQNFETCINDELIIEKAKNSYSDKYKIITKDFYLKF